MTDSNKVKECKRQIQIIIGEAEYGSFIQQLANSLETMEELSRRYCVNTGTLRRWIDVLGYRDSGTRRCLKMYYKRLARIKERQLRNEKLTKFLMFNSKIGKG